MPGRHAASRAATLSGRRLWLADVRAPGTRRVLRAAIALLAAAAAAFLVLVPRVADRAYDDELGDRIARSTDGMRDIGLRLKTGEQWGGFGAVDERVPLQAPEPPFSRVDSIVRDRLGPDVIDLVTEATHAAQTDPFVLSRRQTPLPVDPPQAVVRIQSGLADRVEWVAGAAPGPATQSERMPIPAVEGEIQMYRRVEIVPVAVAAQTAAEWGIEVGDRLDLAPAGTTPRDSALDAVVEVVGIFEATDPGAAFWRADGRILGTASVPTPDGGAVSQGSLLAAEEAYAALSQAIWPMPEGFPPMPSPAFEHTWRYRIADSGLTVADAAVLRDGVARLRTATGGWDGDPPSIATGLPAVLDRFARDVQVTSVLTLFASAGVAALAAFTLMAGVLALVRVREAELRLLAARGGSRGQLTRLLVGDAAVWVVLPAAAAGLLTLLASGLLGGSWAVPGRVLVLAGLVIVAPLVVAAVLAGRLSAPGGTHGDSRVSRVRRMILELGVVVAAVLLVLQLRGRAESITGGTGDWIAALVPAVLGLALGLLAVRVVPALARLTTAAARRVPGATPLLAGAGQRATAAAVLPIIAIVMGTALAGFLATVGLSVTTDRDIAAYQRIAADARIDARRIDPADLSAVGARPEVEFATVAFVAPQTLLTGTSRTAEVELVAADVGALEGIRARTPIALTTATQVAAEPVGADRSLAVAVSRAVLPDERVEIRVGGQRIPARVVAVDPALARAADGLEVDVALVDLEALGEVAAVQPTTIFVAAADRSTDPLAGLPRIPLETTRLSHAGVVADTAERPAARFVTASFLGSAALAAALLASAVALTVLATRGARTVLGHRAAILGMSRRGQRKSELLGLLPMVLLVALAGAVLGTVLPLLVGPAIDLTSITGAIAGAQVTPRVVLPLGIGLGTALLALALLIVDRRVLRRRPLSSTLREGDHR